MDERLTQIIPAQPGYRLVIIDHHQHEPSWSMTPVIAWGLVRDEKHDLENRPGHWEGVVALWQHEDPTFPALTWERDDGRESKVWIMLGPNDPDPPDANVTKQWQQRRKDWQQGLRRERETGQDT